MVFALQTIPQTSHLGGILRWCFCVIPCYCVTHGIIISSSLDLLTAAQPSYPQNLWAFKNLLGDACALGAHFVFGIIFLVIVETDIFACIGKWTIRATPARK